MKEESDERRKDSKCKSVTDVFFGPIFVHKLTSFLPRWYVCRVQTCCTVGSGHRCEKFSSDRKRAAKVALTIWTWMRLGQGRGNRGQDRERAVPDSKEPL